MRDSEFTKTSVGAAFAAWMGYFIGPNTVLSSTQGQFMVPIADSFGLSRTAISFVMLISPIVVTLCLPAAGRAMDRWGLRKVLIPGLVLFGIAHMALAAAATLWHLVGIMVLLSVAAAVHSSVGYAKVISQWFTRNRGAVLGTAVALGSGAGSTMLPQLMRVLIRDYTWRGAYLALGTIILVLGLPTMLLWLREPVSADRTHKIQGASRPVVGVTRAVALKGRTFWLLFVAILFTSIALLGTIIHAYPMLTERGFSPEIATTAVSTMFLGSVFGQLLFGVLVDRIDSPRAALPFFTGALIGVLIVHSAAHAESLLPGAILLGLALGAENGLAAYMTSRYFGLLAYGSIFGWVFAAACLGAGVGLMLMGVAHDASGSYGPMRMLFGVLVAIALLCIALLPPYVYPSGRHVAAGEISPGSA